MRAALFAIPLTLLTTGAAAIHLSRLPTIPALHRVNAQADAVADTDFLFRLGMLEGHLLIAHELIAAHQDGLALPHFGHPVRELYQDITDYLGQHRFPAFDRQLIALEALATSAPQSAATEAKYQAVIATVHQARALTPVALRASLPEMIRICSDTIDAASGDFGELLEAGRVAALVEYHDSRGFLAFVAEEVNALKADHKDAPSQTLLARFETVLAKAQWIVGELLPAPTPRASLGEYRAIAAEAASIAKE